MTSCCSLKWVEEFHFQLLFHNHKLLSVSLGLKCLCAANREAAQTGNTNLHRAKSSLSTHLTVPCFAFPSSLSLPRMPENTLTGMDHQQWRQKENRWKLMNWGGGNIVTQLCFRFILHTHYGVEACGFCSLLSFFLLVILNCQAFLQHRLKIRAPYK